MGRELTLLERIARGAGSARQRYEATAEEDIEAMMESVRRHLGHLLNSRHGMCECLPDYGLPALSDLTVGVKDYVQSKGVTVLLSSHNMLEVEHLCDRVALIDEGKLVEIGTPKELIAKYEALNLEEVFIRATGTQPFELEGDS